MSGERLQDHWSSGLNKSIDKIYFSLCHVDFIFVLEPSNAANQKEKQFHLFSMVLSALEAVVIFFISFKSTILNTS